VSFDQIASPKARSVNRNNGMFRVIRPWKRTGRRAFAEMPSNARSRSDSNTLGLA
jgi:hypothetical protein